MTMTIEEIIMSEKRHRNKRNRKCKLLDVFSFFSCRGQKTKKWETTGSYKGRVKRKTFRFIDRCRGPSGQSRS